VGFYSHEEKNTFQTIKFSEEEKETLLTLLLLNTAHSAIAQGKQQNTPIDHSMCPEAFIFALQQNLLTDAERKEVVYDHQETEDYYKRQDISRFVTSVSLVVFSKPQPKPLRIPSDLDCPCAH
jgi:hypothetical protein